MAVDSAALLSRQAAAAPAPPGPCEGTRRTQHLPSPTLKYELPVEKHTSPVGASSHVSGLNSQPLALTSNIGTYKDQTNQPKGTQREKKTQSADDTSGTLAGPASIMENRRLLLTKRPRDKHQTRPGPGAPV
ncbi:hypothetical protein GHT09_016057 [Marmota monax]|uniref:Uncharacterized protein n=1 Tax=Marmota monax TaxID=9995 RepID=A0A834Q9E7_MARMO|nr:hypothetical protein GHT09_016057 [Marmota monax]